jgi:hypothetical protein
MKRALIPALAVGGCLAVGAEPAHAGPCTTRIAQFEQAVRQSSATVGAGPTEKQSVGAQLRHQPTPDSVKEAEARAQTSFDAVLARAKDLDAQGDEAGCTAALTEAQRMFNLQ